MITFGGGFHGRTYMTMALTGKVAPYKIGFGPFLVPFSMRNSRMRCTVSVLKTL